MTDGSVREVPGSLAEYEPVLLKRPGFIKTHRCYLVNLQWVMELTKNELVTASGQHVPVSRTEYPRVRAAYTLFLFADKEEPAQEG